jgi:hypothetical protein
MTAYCVLCNQFFSCGKALKRHKRIALAHFFDCTICDQHFGTGMTLRQQHQGDFLADPLSENTRGGDVTLRQDMPGTGTKKR